MIKKIYAGLMVGLLACVAFSGVAFAQCAGGGTFGYAADGTPVCSSASYGVTPYGSVAGDGLPQGSSNSGGSGRTQPTRTVIVNRYGAVAFDGVNNSFGYFSNASTRDEASAGAIKDCATAKCKVFGTYQNACGSLVFGNKAKSGYTVFRGGSNLEAAKINALKECSKKAKNCQVLVAECSIYGK